MTISLLGIQGAFSLSLPNRPAGYVLIGACLLGLAWLLVASESASDRSLTPKTPNPQLRLAEIEWFLVLLFLAPIAAETLMLRLPGLGGGAAVGLPRALAVPGIGVLAAVPWVLAAGYLGVWQAVIVGLAAGLARGGWETQSMATPLMVAFEAGLAAWLMRQNYRESFARLARQPLAACLAAAAVVGGLRLVEVYAYSPGTLYDGLDFALQQSGPGMVVTLLEGLVGGVVGQILLMTGVGIWTRPTNLRAGPYNRSLAARMVSTLSALGLLSLVVLSSGQWYLARTSARDLIEDQMRQTAAQASGAVPFFIQAGRQVVRGLALKAEPLLLDPSADATELALGQSNQVFFDRTALFDGQGALLTVSPADQSLLQPLPTDLVEGLKVGLQGVPQEIVVRGADRATEAELVFITPVIDPVQNQTLGVMAGWTGLESNPLISPALGLLKDSDLGDTYIIDGQGVILFHPQGQDLLSRASFSTDLAGEVSILTSTDGTRVLEYVQPVEGYPWKVVVMVPQRVVDRMAVPIAARLLAVVSVVGAFLLVFVYVTSRRVTQPVRQMASTAEAIARGDLERTVTAAGEDEVGRLATSFERMRRSLKGRLEAMDLLLRVSQTLASRMELEASLIPILDGLASLTGADVVRLVTVPEVGGLDQGPALESARLEGRWGALDEQILALCRQRGQFALENPSRARAVLDVERTEADVEVLMAFPILNEHEYLGALWLAHGQHHLISPDETNLTTIVSAQIGVWLANVRLFQRAQEERLRLAAVLDATPDSVLVIDRLGRILLANPAAEVVLKGPAENALGQPAQDWIAFPELLAQLTAPEPESQVIEVQLEGGRVLSAASRDIEVGGQERSGRVCVLWDITHYKKLDMLKSEFVSTVSHDLRAPLTLMRGYSTMMTMVGSLNDQQRDFVAKILDSVDQMGGLVENLLDLGRIEAGLGLNLEVFDFDDLLEEVLNAHRPQAINKRIGLEVETDGAGDPVEADRTLLRQAVSNLTDNAIKYTQSGGQVVVQARQARGRLMFSIRDTGMGISPADQARLFERFYRARRQESLKERGTGLGLAIVKSIIEQHGGSVSVESRLGAGSTFSFEIPLHPQPAVQALEAS